MPLLSDRPSVRLGSHTAAVWGMCLHFTGPALSLLRSQYGIFDQTTPAAVDDKGESVPGIAVSILARPLAEPPLIQKAPKADLLMIPETFPSNLSTR
jgi:hypothetical protein